MRQCFHFRHALSFGHLSVNHRTSNMPCLMFSSLSFRASLDVPLNKKVRRNLSVWLGSHSFKPSLEMKSCLVTPVFNTGGILEQSPDQPSGERGEQHHDCWPGAGVWARDTLLVSAPAEEPRLSARHQKDGQPRHIGVHATCLRGWRGWGQIRNSTTAT